MVLHVHGPAAHLAHQRHGLQLIADDVTEGVRHQPCPRLVALLLGSEVGRHRGIARAFQVERAYPLLNNLTHAFGRNFGFQESQVLARVVGGNNAVLVATGGNAHSVDGGVGGGDVVGVRLEPGEGGRIGHPRLVRHHDLGNYLVAVIEHLHPQVAGSFACCQGDSHVEPRYFCSDD